jgi:hypothetical protein
VAEIGVYDSTLRLEETVVPSPNSVDLSRSIANDYINRFSNVTPNVAEIFHLNSKVSRFSALEVPAGREVLLRARDWFYRGSYTLGEEDFVAEFADQIRRNYDTLPEPLGSFLANGMFDARFSSLLHAMDLFVLSKGTLLRALPRRKFLWVERQFDDALLRRMAGSFYGEGVRPDPANEVLIFLVGSFWRFMKFYGPRGYRMVLMDCGELLAELEQNLSVTRFENVYDTELEECLLLDGVERSFLACLSLGQPA